MPKSVAEMNPEQAVEFALGVMLDQGFNSKYYSHWKELARADYDEYLADEDEEYWPSLPESSGAWEALNSYVNTNIPYETDGITVRYEGNQASGAAVSNSAYFVVFSLEDASDKRFFLRDGYYSSYEGGNLVEATDKEVFPKEKTVTLWRSTND